MVVKVMQRGHMTDISQFYLQEQNLYRMKSMSMKSTCRKSLITETIQEYIEASNITRKLSIPAHLNKQGERNELQAMGHQS